MRQLFLNPHHFRVVAVVVVAGLLSPGVVWGQLGGIGMGTGTGTGTSGRSGSGGTQSSSLFGGRTLGGSNARPGGGVAPAAMQGSTMGTSARFLDANRQGAFVGADTGDTRNAISAQSGVAGLSGRGSMQGLQGLQGLGNMFSSLGRNNSFGNNQNGQRSNARAQLRIPIRIGFQSKPVASTRVMTEFQTRLTKLPALTGVGKIQVALEGSTAVLRGTVATEGDKQLAADLAMLEPAIADVRNELVVDPAVTTAEVLAPTNPSPATRP